MSDPINVADLEKLARERMEPSAYDYDAGGANDVGASAVLIGRAYLWGLSDGEVGVRKVLEIFRTELELAMALAGCASIQTITRSHVAPWAS